MTVTALASKGVHYVRIGLAGLAMFQFTIGAPFANAASQPKPQTTRDSETTSPIKHVIVIIGENRSFDHVFATYMPKSGETVNNLLSEGIITLDSNKNAIPGPNFSKAQQLSATDTDSFLLDPPTKEFPSNVLPAPLVGGPSGANGYFTGPAPCPANPTLSPVQCAEVSETGLPGYTYYQDLASGGTGLKSKTPDGRITSVETLPAGPFQITNGSTFLYNDYAASPVHRFYQMWQQLNCGLGHINADNPSGCNASLFSWVEVTVAAGTNGITQLNLFEGFTEKIVNLIENSPYWQDTAIFITEDEGGGYYDSGYVQPLDFFGDGTRIPLLVVSKYSTGGHINHSYSDHVSIDKFIERNWSIAPITSRSRDNFPNPVTKAGNPYVPLNGPALDDLFDAFHFPE